MRWRQILLLKAIVRIISISALYLAVSGSLHAADDWVQIEGDGFGVSHNRGIDSLVVFEVSDTTYIWAGVANPGGCELWRSTDNGETWAWSNRNGFGDTNYGVPSMVSWNGYIYIGTRNPGGCQIWRRIHYGLMEKVVDLGFGDPTHHLTVSSMTSFGDHLYAGTWGFEVGCGIWRTENGTDWVLVNSVGFGVVDNDNASAMTVFDGDLYVGTRNDVSGAEVWMSPDGTNWTQVAASGFGTTSNYYVSALTVFDGYLYAGTHLANGADDGCDIWRTADGSSWESVVTDGWGISNNKAVSSMVVNNGTLFAATDSTGPGGSPAGTVVWRTKDGVSWVQSSEMGFGSAGNTSTDAALVVDGQVFIGTVNVYGAQVWRLDESSVFTDGFETGDTSWWGETRR